MTETRATDRALPAFDALILDMDGVIVDTPSLHRRVWTEFVERAPWPEVRAQRSRSSGRRAQDVLTELLAHRLSSGEIDRVVEELHGDFLRLRGDLDTVFPAMRELIGASDFPLAVATSAPRHVVEALLGDLVDRFEVVVTSEDCAAGKPNPEAYRRAREGLGVAPGRALVVEDTAIGVTAAVAAECVAWAIVSDDAAAAACYAAGAAVLCRDAATAAGLVRSEFEGTRSLQRAG